MTKGEKRQKLKTLEDITTTLLSLIEGLPGEDDLASEWFDVQADIEDAIESLE